MTSTIAITAASLSSSLVRLVDGEYTAASVSADPTAAARLDLLKLKDGNYAQLPISPSLLSSVTTSLALSALQLGGA